MKRSTKIISLILSVIMVFSFVPVIAGAGAVPANVTSVENLITNDNIAALGEWLLKNINSSKDNTVGSILRLVFSLVKNEDLQKAVAGKDVTKLTDEQLADILVNWVNSSVLSGIKMDSTVKGLLKALGIDISNVNAVMTSLEGLTSNALVKAVGDLKYLTSAGLKAKNSKGKTAVVNTKNGFTNLDIVKALLTWLTDGDDSHGQMAILKKLVKGELKLGKVLGYNLTDLVGLNDINAMMKNLPSFLKGFIYLLIDGHAAKPDLKKDPKGGWGTSAYKDYNADQMLAAALIRICKSYLNDEGKIETPDAVIAKADCDAALKLTVYELLAKYGPDLYTNLAVKALNTKAKEAFNGIKRDYPDVNIENYINLDYRFTSDTFKDEFANIKTTGVLGQLNNILVKAAATMLTADTNKNLKLEKGTNADKLNSNLTKALRVALPLLNIDSVEEKLGFNFDAFTAKTVADMDLEKMATAVLKIFFPTWFKDVCKAADLDKADTLEKLGTLAVFYTFKKFVPENVKTAAGIDKMTLDLSKITSQDAAFTKVLDMSGKTAACAVASVPETHYTVPSGDYLNSIVDWALSFVAGLPACNTAALRADKDMYKKANTVLNALVDFSFINGCDKNGFVLDTETLIYKGLLGNILDFNVAGVIGLLEKNTKADNSLNKVTVSAVLGIVDKALTALFVDNSVAKGDVDGNGNVDVSDARLALRRSINLEKYAEGSREFLACDVDGNGKVEVTDARKILRVAIKLDKDF